MGLFEQFPYTNFHELNLDWILHELRDLEIKISNFVAINSVKYANPILWDITRQYETNTVVLDSSGNAYLSVQPVPVGVSLDREEYWTKIGNFSALWDSVRKSITPYDEEHSQTASRNYTTSDWVWSEDNLLLVTKNITAGDKLVDGGNCKITNIHDLFKTLGDMLTGEINNLSSELQDEIEARENGDTALETKINQEINNLSSELQDEIEARENGDTALETKINQEIAPLKIKAWVTPLDFGAVADGVTDCTTQVQAALNSGTPVFMPKNILYQPEQLIFPKNCILGDMHKDGRLYWRMVGDEGGAVNEFIFQSPYHSAIIVDTAPDIIKGDNVLPEQDRSGPSFNLRYNNAGVWQLINNHAEGDTLAFEAGPSYSMPLLIGKTGVRIGYKRGNLTFKQPAYNCEIVGNMEHRSVDSVAKVITVVDSTWENITGRYEIEANIKSLSIFDVFNTTKKLLGIRKSGIVSASAIGGSLTTEEIKALPVDSDVIGISTFNKSVGKPVWLKSVNPAVWVYADGTTML